MGGRKDPKSPPDTQQTHAPLPPAGGPPESASPGNSLSEETLAGVTGEQRQAHPTGDADELYRGGRLQVVPLVYGGQGLLVGPRVPRDYFVTQGWGDTDGGEGADPFETGAYDMALERARIHQFNIIQYTSVLPPEVREISHEEAQRYMRHGAVLESIMSMMHGKKGERISAGVGRIQVRRKSDRFHIGGYAAEYKGNAGSEEVKAILREDLHQLVARRYNPEEFEAFNESFTVQEHHVERDHGTVLAALCFCSFIHPLVSAA